MTEITQEAYDRLAQYWGRAQIMRGLLDDLIEANDRIEKTLEAGYGLRLETYLSFWMAGLFVTVEGFNKLGVKDPQVQTLFNAHLNSLKELRHETYHFSVARGNGAKAIAAINWVEDLHVTLGLFLGKHVDLSGITR